MIEFIENHPVGIRDVGATAALGEKIREALRELMTSNHEKFPKIPRLNRTMVITEKIDGTNGQILITEDGEVRAGSRKRWITPKDNNFGFAAWVKEHEDELHVCLGPGRHFGEWWGEKINRGYGLSGRYSPARRFSLFNVRRWRDHTNARWNNHPWLKEYEKRQRAPYCCGVVPILAIEPFNTERIDSILELLDLNGSLAAPGFMQPEGIVIYHTAGNNLFKVTIENDEGKRK